MTEHRRRPGHPDVQDIAKLVISGASKSVNARSATEERGARLFQALLDRPDDHGAMTLSLRLVRRPEKSLRHRGDPAYSTALARDRAEPGPVDDLQAIVETPEGSTEQSSRPCPRAVRSRQALEGAHLSSPERTASYLGNTRGVP